MPNGQPIDNIDLIYEIEIFAAADISFLAYHRLRPHPTTTPIAVDSAMPRYPNEV